MKKILFIAAMLCTFMASAQIGANYVNLDTYGDSLSMVWMCEASDFIVPVRLRTDKEKSSELQTATLEKCKQFHRIANRMGKTLDVCYTANLWATPETNLQGINDLVNYGINVSVVEVGNEYYSIIKDDYGSIDFAYYQPKAQALRDAVSAEYPLMTFVYPACPSPKGSGISPERNDHKLWNEALAAYLYGYPNDTYVWHVYYDKFDSPVLEVAEQGLQKQIYSGGSNMYLSDFYSDYYYECMNSLLWEKSVSYADSLFGRKGYFTEYGTVGSGNIRNTYAYAALLFRDGVKWKDSVYLYVHSGIALTGIIQPKNTKYDPATISTPNARRVEYWAIKLANECVNAKPLQATNELKSGTTYYWFVGGANPTFTGKYNATYETHYISANYLYSTGGAAAWMGAGTSKTQEITGINVVSGYSVPAQSFGYIKVTATPVPVYGCTDKSATNYNADATIDDGSCVIITPACYRKRWLLRSLPCKPATTNCNCK